MKSLFRKLFNRYSVPHILEGFNETIEALREAAKHHAAKGQRKYGKVCKLQAEVREHDEASAQAIRVANKIQGLVN